MNEKELREKLVSVAVSFLGCKESDGTHKQIIDIYNSKTPLPAGYKMTYKDAWCATYVTAVGIASGLSDIVLRECSCERMISLYKKAGRWIENDAYTPQKGDIIFYDWEDKGVGDDVGHSDHVGIVASVNGTTLKIIEGNITDSVGYRTIKVNGKYIRGYGLPNYASKATASSPSENLNSNTVTTPVPSAAESTVLKYNVGDIVKFTGTTHYVSSNSTSPKACKAGTAKITNRSSRARHPYHLVAEKGRGSTVYGWVDADDISGKVSTVAGNSTGINNKVDAVAKVDDAKSFSESLKGEYKTTTGLNLRAGANTSKPILAVMSKGSKVTCYGYYTNFNGTKWYYVTYMDSKGVRFTGFASSKYLKK